MASVVVSDKQRLPEHGKHDIESQTSQKENSDSEKLSVVETTDGYAKAKHKFE